MSSRKSSGKYRSKHPFNPIQIKNGMVVRLRKDGTVKAVLGKYGEYNKKDRA
jgi:GTP cyclohydrolase II